MSTPTISKVVYPESDGKPMADNTLQFQWIVTIKENLALQYQGQRVFVAGDLLWYPVEGEPTICQAPDALVAFDRPPGHRGSYRQWEEEGIAPQVVFEIVSPSNRLNDAIRKFRFYERYKVEEYYVYDPDRLTLDGWLRRGDELVEIPNMSGWVSPRLGIRFELGEQGLQLFHPDGSPFLTFPELDQQRREAQQQAVEARLSAETALRRAEEAEQRNERLAAQLRGLGIQPEL
ncbi:MAG: Uma2 family endonuclease [Gemmataceae bacterium]|nr:Uma2 family endonuclease [Gemmataceae bacterium]